jgi:tripartite-type tricarboxylate transporter receptor subunit TctC
LGMVSSGRLRLLGHSMGADSHPLSGVPAIEQTVPGFEFSSWIGLMGPRGVPAAAADSLRAALVEALKQPMLRESFEANGAVPTPSSAQEFRDYVARDIEQNRAAIKIAGVQPE